MAKQGIDTSDLIKLADVFVDASNVAPADARAIIKRGAQNIKTDAQDRVRGSKHFPRLAAAITYESQQTLTGASAEVGPDPDKPQGNLGHIPEYGSPTSPPRPYMAPAGKAEEPRLAQAMEAAAVKRLER